MEKLIKDDAIAKRADWIEEIHNLSGDFGENTSRLEKKLADEIKKQGVQALIDHVRLCGAIPESYGHDSSEEKLYSKYTDALLCESFKSIGLKSLVLTVRADAADVEAYAKNYSFVADAKAFRLSRTAKNQKDFKVQAVHRWKHDKKYAMVVCPIYQLPTRSSQIYVQATSLNVCVFTYSHLSVLINFAQIEGNARAEEMLEAVFKSITALNPSKDAFPYWSTVNNTMLGYSKELERLWKIEKQAAVESIAIAKNEALTFLANEREKIMRMSHQDALLELVRVHKIENRSKIIQSFSGNNILDIR